MGYAAHRVWQAGGGPLPLALYAVGGRRWPRGPLLACVVAVWLPPSRAGFVPGPPQGDAFMPEAAPAAAPMLCACNSWAPAGPPFPAVLPAGWPACLTPLAHPPNRCAGPAGPQLCVVPAVLQAQGPTPGVPGDHGAGGPRGGHHLRVQVRGHRCCHSKLLLLPWHVSGMVWGLPMRCVAASPSQSTVPATPLTCLRPPACTCRLGAARWTPWRLSCYCRTWAGHPLPRCASGGRAGWAARAGAGGAPMP